MSGTLIILTMLIKDLQVQDLKRFWTHIIYLTEGKPFEIGSWSPKGERVEQTDFSAPNQMKDFG